MLRCFPVVCVIVYFFCGCLQTKAAEFEPLSDKLLPLMNKITLKIKSNMEGIKTWQGKVLYKRKEPSGKWVDDIEITFYVDCVHDRRLVVSKHIKTEIDGIEQPLDIIGLLLKDDIYYEYRTQNLDGPIHIPAIGRDLNEVRLKDIKEGNVRGFKDSFLYGYLRIDQRAMFRFSKSNLKDNFDPFVVLLDGNDPTQNSMCAYLALIIHHKPVHNCDIRVKSEGTVVDVSYFCPGPDSPVPSVYVHDIALGGNLTYSYVPCFGKAQVRKVEYEKKGGIFVPKNVSFKLRDEIHETIEFIEQKINEPIDDKVFSPVTLGAKRGDTYYDTRTDLRSKITDTSFLEHEPIITLPRKTSFIPREVFLITGTVLLSFMLYHVYRQRYIATMKKQSQDERTTDD